MPTDPSTRMGLEAHDGSDPANTIDDTTQALVAAVDAQSMIYGQGSLAARPQSSPATPGIQGRLYYSVDAAELAYDTGTGWVPVSQGVGDLKVSVRIQEHGGWIKADGRALVSGNYPQLRAVLLADGAPYGSSAGDPRLPDLRQRVPVGAGAARPVGQMGGAEVHQLINQEMPYHHHGGATGGDDRDHAHQFVHTYPGYRNNNLGGSGVNIASWDTQQWEWTTGRNTGHLHGINPDGASWAHNNMQPFTVMHYFVFAGPVS